MIVADANLLAYLVIDSGTLTRQAEHVRAREKIWAAPALVRHELLNVFGKYVRGGRLGRDEGARDYRRALSMIDISLEVPNPISILGLVAESGCSTYDCEYVWLAKELDVQLITADVAIVRAYPGIAVSLDGFA